MPHAYKYQAFKVIPTFPGTHNGILFHLTPIVSIPSAIAVCTVQMPDSWVATYAPLHGGRVEKKYYVFMNGPYFLGFSCWRTLT